MQGSLTILKSKIPASGDIMRAKEIVDKGKPGESRGRKANGSTVTQVTRIARPPKAM